MMRRWAILPLSALVAASAMAQGERRVAPVDGGRRLALVMGNAAYTSIDRLLNPINDARAVATTLKTVGFADRDVHLVIDAPRDEMRRSVRGFVESVKRGDLAFVYYAGHGVEVKGTNYLLPVDVPRDATEGYVEDEAVSAQRLLRDLDDQGARVRILVLDACRDNPLRASRSAGGGLAPMEGKGSLVVFSTEAGRTASDTPGQTNSVFTRYLLEGLQQPGVSIDDAMKRVSRNVARATGERQIPAIYGLLLDDVMLVSGPAAAAPAPIVVNPNPVVSGPAVNAPTGRAVLLQGSPKRVMSLAWSPDGRWFVAGAPDGSVTVYDHYGKFLTALVPGGRTSTPTMYVAVSKDGRYVAASGSMPNHPEGAIEKWEASGWKAIWQTFGPGAIGTHFLAFSPDGKILAAANEQDGVRGFDGPTGQLDFRSISSIPAVRRRKCSLQRGSRYVFRRAIHGDYT